jgi:ferric iron reductase protein FhuF
MLETLELDDKARTSSGAALATDSEVPSLLRMTSDHLKTMQSNSPFTWSFFSFFHIRYYFLFPEH